MAGAKKLPSGNYRCLVFSHIDDGKRIYESFTASTKAEAELMAAQFKTDRKRKQSGDITVQEALEKYIDSNDGTLSESTIAGYDRAARSLSPLYKIPIGKLTSEDIQKFISSYKKGRSAKTVKNVVSLLRSSILMFRPDIRLDYTLPMYVRPKIRIPLDDEISALFHAASDWMKLAIVLGCQSVRRSEICAIKLKDIEKVDNKTYRVHVHGDCVKNRNHEWVWKDTPKTPESDRYVYIPAQAYDLITATEPDEYIVNVVPSSITSRFGELRDKLGISMSFHGTRHFYASIYAMLGVPDFATAEMGGWKHVDRTMKEIYQGVQENKKREYLSIGQNYIASLIK